jgi:hypothetical protein
MQDSSKDLPSQDEPELTELPGLVADAAEQESAGVQVEAYDLRLTAERAPLR